MGTDIHGVFQRHNGTTWEDIPSLYEQDRHYQLFAALAGYSGHAISEPRGLPDDFQVNWDNDYKVSSIDVIPNRRQKHCQDLQYWLGDHTYSWLTGQEMLAWYSEHKDTKEELAYFFNEVKRLQVEYGTVRFVFGFDS